MALTSTAVPADLRATGAPASFLFPSIWQAPLVPAALAVTAGIVADHYLSVPLPFSLLLATAGLVLWAATRSGKQPGLRLVYLALGGAAIGAAYHHWHRDVYPRDDLGHYATPEPRPARVRGVLVEEPEVVWQVANDPLRSFGRTNPTVTVLQASHLREGDDWIAVSGRARVVVSGEVQGFHVGDRVEVIGRLVAPGAPDNPGEFDFASYLRDQRIRAQLLVEKTTDGLRRLEEGWRWSLAGWLVVLRGWGQQQLKLSPDYRPNQVGGAA
jgi:competence protein ComEC